MTAYRKVCRVPLMQKQRLPIAPHIRVMRRVEMVTESGCWIFMGHCDPQGYARTSIPFKNGWVVGYGHRIMYEAKRGTVPAGLTLDHLCRVRCCVNPSHLEAVTMRENILRGTGFAARLASQTCCPKCGGAYSVISRGDRICHPCTKALRRKRYAAGGRARKVNKPKN